MKTKMRKYRGEFRRYGLLLAVPLLLCLALFFCVRSVMYRQLSENGETAVRGFRAEAYGVLRELQIVSDSIAADGALQEFVTRNARPDDPLSVSRILAAHCGDSPYISDVYLVCPEQSCIYSQKAYFNYDALPVILQDTAGIDPDALTDPDTLGWHILNANYAAPHYITAIPDSDAMLLVTLNKTSFIRTIYGNSSFCCLFNDSFSVSSTLDNYPAANWYSEAEVSAIVGQPVKCFYLEQDGYTYMTALTLREYNAPLKTILLVFGVYIAVCLLFGLCYLQAVSRKRYAEAVAMIDGLPHAVSGDSSYEEIVEAMRQSLETYKKQYNDQLRFKQRNQVLSLLLGTKSARQTDALERAGLREGIGYYVALIHFTDGPGVAVNMPVPTNIDVSCTLLYSALAKAAGDYMDVAVTHTERNYVAVLAVRSELVTKEDVRFLLDETVYAAESEYGSSLIALASRRVESAENIPEAYKEAVSLYEFALRAGTDVSVLLRDDMENDAGVLLSGDFGRQLQLVGSTIQLEKYELVPSMVEALLKEHVSQLGNYYALAKSRTSAVANLLAEAAAASRLPEAEALDFVAALQRADSIPELNRLTAELSAALGEHGAETQEPDLVTQACRFIRDNLADANLSVPDVSEAVGVSAQHLSRLFRRRFDRTVVEYINAARIEKARELILEKGMTVNRVSEAVGYSNNVTFSRNFHRYVGLSPSEYRQLNQ